ncbi:MAG: SDR family oxidoreductase [Flavobacterium sp.]|nr:MAG: SDR family oxidoreductase [Flavobacterium sp.]
MNAIITAATKGIGRAIAFKLAQSGYHLSLCARTETDLLALQNELQTYGVNVFVKVADLTSKADVLAFAEFALNSLKTVDVLVNNAGVFMPDVFLDEPTENFELQQNVNVNATYLLSKEIGKNMRLNTKGHIFNICSVASLSPADHAGSYSVTKAAMLSLNNVLRKELAQYKVKVTAILPGATLTASWGETTIDHDKFVQPADVADTLYSILNLSKGANVDEVILTPLNF